MNNITEYYIKYFTVVIFIIGFIMGLMQVFNILLSYKAASEITFNQICLKEYGDQYYYDDHDSGIIICKKESNEGFNIRKRIYLYD